MGKSLSRPKDKIKILLLEGISDTAVNTLRAAGYTNVERLTKALEGNALREALKGVSMVGIRSRTQLTAEALDGMRSLVAVGCFSVGTNQVDLDAARHMGLPVFNAPFSNTRSVAELTIAEIVMLFRAIFPKSVRAHAGGWDKSAVGANEVRGKTLGIVGYGNIGSQLACSPRRWACVSSTTTTPTSCATAMSSRPTALDDLLAQSDVVSLHVPETPADQGHDRRSGNRADEAGRVLINNSARHRVRPGRARRRLRSSTSRGAAIDVFPVEPAANAERFVSPLQDLDNVILTPHVGGSTEEAQERIGSEVARKFVEFSDVGSTTGSRQLPSGATAAAARRHALHPGAEEPAR